VTSAIRRPARLAVALVVLAVPALAGAQQAPASALSTAGAQITFAKDIVPILQRSCQNCHRPGGVGPMSLVSYEDVRPWARSIKAKTGLRGRPGTMPPWFVDKTIGIQKYKNDPSLSEAEIQEVASWVDSGAPMGNPADMPPPLQFADDNSWRIGPPDLILKTPSVQMKATAPDWWGPIGEIESGLTQDRYVAAVEYKEISEFKAAPDSRKTVGSRFIFHHLCWGAAATHGTQPVNAADVESFPCHEVGRNADVFDPEMPRLLKANSKLLLSSSHLHANGKDTTSYIELGFKFFPVGYQPPKKARRMGLFGNSMNLDIRPLEANQSFQAFTVLTDPMKIESFEPHMHAAGVRMCLDAIYGAGVSFETLSCVGYDHSWVRVYNYTDDAMPLLPRGTILRITGTFDNTSANRNVADPRNWSGLGHRSIDNMMNDLGDMVYLTDAEFQVELAKRRRVLGLKPGQSAPGCPLCGTQAAPSSTNGNQQ
jgi:mono/diheme cytochrome c family protein